LTHYFKSGNTVQVKDSRSLDVYDMLPADTNYVVKVDQYGVYFLEEIDAFTLPKKVYGGNDGRRDRIIQSFLDRPRSTGVLLSGEKGSGKTLLTKSLSIELAKQGIPTLIVNAPYQGDGFNKFMQTIQQPCVVLFDEFEKVYEKDDQEKLLTLLDGVFPSKKLFLLTMNSGYIDPHMRNRPGRIFYQYTYRGLSAEFIREYCEDCLNDKSQIDKLVLIADCFTNFNFDMLAAVVEDMNRYNESAANAMQNVNARLEFDLTTRSYDIEVSLNGTKVLENYYSPRQLRGSPLVMDATNKPEMDFYGVPNGKKDDDGDFLYYECPDFELTDERVLKIEKGGSIVYEFITPVEKNRVLVRVVKPQPETGGFNFNAF
jgi:hypothetical protein